MNQLKHDMIKVLIADDHPVVRQGIRTIIEQTPNFRIIKECCNGLDTLNSIIEMVPDLAVIDISMPDMNGIKVIKSVRQAKLPVEFIVLTMYPDISLFDSALSEDVKGYLLKENALNNLSKCIKDVADGKPYYCAEITSMFLKAKKDPGNDEIKSLSLMEKKIMTLIKIRMTNREIAGQLYVSIRTVENHRNNICKKLKLHGPHALFEFVMKNDI